MRLSAGAPLIMGLGCTLAAALTDVPTPDNFQRRVWATATLLGDYVYIDGGDLDQLADGEGSGTYPVNSTLSLDMTKSWKNLDVTFRSIRKPGPAKANVCLWTDPSANTFYSWGGRWSGGKNMVKNALWKFVADGKGGGEWSIEPPANPTLFNGLLQTEYAAYVTVGSTGYVISGVADAWTQVDQYSADPLPGMVAFDMKSKIWQNGTINFSPFGTGTLNQGSAVYMPGIGANGLVLVFGGYAPIPGNDLNESDGPPLDLRNITFFDPETKRVYSQVTTGDIPPTPRGQACTAGFPTKDGGFDMFLFGGVNGRDRFTYGDAYILSVPGFVWQRVPDSQGGIRSGASCLAVGKRQVLSIGGSGDSRSSADPAPQGLMLFDMTTLKWKDDYDADAAAYERNADLKKWYSNGSLAEIHWSSNDVKSLFADLINKPDPSSTDGSPSSTATSSPVTSDSPDSGSSTPIGPIVGGVMGGVAAVALVVAAAWVMIRRRRNSLAAAANADGNNNNLNDNKTHPEHGLYYPSPGGGGDNKPYDPLHIPNGPGTRNLVEAPGSPYQYPEMPARDGPGSTYPFGGPAELPTQPGSPNVHPPVNVQQHVQGYDAQGAYDGYYGGNEYGHVSGGHELHGNGNVDGTRNGAGNGGNGTANGIGGQAYESPDSYGSPQPFGSPQQQQYGSPPQPYGFGGR